MALTIVGLCGFAGAGKDTFADKLTQKWLGLQPELSGTSYTISFADALKNATAAIFGVDRENLSGRTTKSREWREQPHEFWSKKLNKVITPRYMLQWMGDVMRDNINQEIFVWIMESQIENIMNERKNDPTLLIIPDVRFRNEIAMIEKYGGRIIQINRKAAQPQGYGTPDFDKTTLHKSEYSWWCEPGEETRRWFVNNDADIATLDAGAYYVAKLLNGEKVLPDDK